MSVTTVSTLVDLLREAGLVQPAQLHLSEADLRTEYNDAQSVGEMLLRRKWLTPYQVAQLLSPEGQSLTIGPYILIEPVGEGGMGQVFKARHRVLERVVALKVIREDRGAIDPESVRRFQREAKAAAALSHPNIVLIYDADRSDDTYFIAMEYIEGTDLARWVKETGPLPLRQACDFIRQAALGLQHAHEAGMVHRDIKPSNLFAAGLFLNPPQSQLQRVSAVESVPAGAGLRSAGRSIPPLDRTPLPIYPVIKILDLGLVRLAQGDDRAADAALTQEGLVIGTPDYIAPEQAINARSVDIRADLYSLGCTFYFLLTGRPPFDGSAPMEKLIRHQLDDPIPVDRLRKGVPGEVALVVHKLLAKDPAKRFQTPGELAAALAVQLRPQLPSVPEADLETTPTYLSTETLPVELILRRPDVVSPPITRARLTAPEIIPTRGGKANLCRSAEHVAFLNGHSGSVLSLAFNSQGDTLATGGRDATTRLWDFSSGQPRQLASLQKHSGAVQSVAFSPDSTLLASGSGCPDGLIWVWELARKPHDIARLQGHRDAVTALAFSPDSGLLASGGLDQTVQVWELVRGQARALAVLKGHTAPIQAIAFSPNGQLIASAALDGIVRLWDISRLRFKQRAVLGHPAAVSSVAFSPEGDLLITGGQDRSVRIWGVNSHSQPKLLGELKDHDGPLRVVLVTLDSRRLVAVGEGRRVTVWNDEGEKIQEWLVPKLQLPKFALTLDGCHLANGCMDGTVNVYRMADEHTP
jgi:serine/threonine-protein kinase